MNEHADPSSQGIDPSASNAYYTEAERPKTKPSESTEMRKTALGERTVFEFGDHKSANINLKVKKSTQPKPTHAAAEATGGNKLVNGWPLAPAEADTTGGSKVLNMLNFTLTEA